MGKQLTFTKKEQQDLPKLISAIGSILLKKLEQGVSRPTLSGTMNIDGEPVEVIFEIIAQFKESEK